MTAQHPPLAVTGSTGALGAKLARLLAEDSQRLLVRTPAKAPNLDNAQVLQMSYADKAAAIRALDGVETLFMVSASESPDRLEQHRTVIDAAAAVGVRHIVYTSFLGAAPDAIFTLARDHHATEQYIAAAGIAYTCLRDNFYMDFMESLVDADGVIRAPADGGRVSIVARADIAHAARAVLREPSAHRNVIYELTGPEALTMAEIAETISEVRGIPVTFYNETIDEAYESRRAYGAPDWQLDAWVSTYTAIAASAVAKISPDIEQLTGSEPITFSQFLSENPVGRPH
jgi:NAD(P)H dehydrogenase (quinone)